MRILTRHVAGGFLRRAAAVAGAAFLIGTAAGAVEEANRPVDAPAGARLLAAVSRAPEVLFFAFPAVCLLAALWTARDLLPGAVSEGLGGAGVRPAGIDRGMYLGAVAAAAFAVLLGGWIAPAAQRLGAPEAPQAWARSGGAPSWTGRDWIWIRRGDALARIESHGGDAQVTRTIPLTGRPADLVAAPTAAELDLLAAPPAWLSLPDLLDAGAVRRSLGHLRAPVDAETALRAAIVALLLPWTFAAAAFRRIPRPARRWAWTAALVVTSLAGLQASAVWAARGEIPVPFVAAASLALASTVAALARRSARRA